jgi:hypothetical protein
MTVLFWVLGIWIGGLGLVTLVGITYMMTTIAKEIYEEISEDLRSRKKNGRL